MADSSRRTISIVFTVVFLDLLGFGIIIPILPFYVRAFGADELVIGLLAASYSAMQFLFAPVLGNLSDRRGRRPIILISVFGSAIAWTLFGLAEGLALLFVSRMLAGAMGGNIAAAQAYVADVTPPEERAKSLGLLGAAFGLGFIFGPGIGAVFTFQVVVDFFQGLIPWVTINQFSLPSFVAAFLALMNFLVAYRFLPESREIADEPVAYESQLTQLKNAILNEDLRGLLVAFFLISFAFSGVQIMFIPYVADIYGYSESQSALLLTYIGVLGVIVQGGLIGRLTNRYTESRLTVFGAALLTVALFGIPSAPLLGELVFPSLTGVASFLTNQLLALLAVLAVLSLGNGIVNVSLTTIVSQKASADRQGSALGLTQGSGSLARTFGPVLMGGIYATIGYWSPFVLGGVLLLPVLAIALQLARNDDAKRATATESELTH
ncbi:MULTISPECIES: MFS transporter [unclassified Haladaptatus]|uniref:MFS transporter n=1 Tax=unclassified Haladaptatus TaxID=2622732 RepID=UPI0023E8B20E|nr:MULTISPECIES: MFS transporter [unclassified Haladaptatus]